ncbi:hypothetical protein PTKIN_Ptkin04bG0026500 [Pterospermum kingtungense]
MIMEEDQDEDYAFLVMPTAKELAEKKLEELDAAGAKRFALKAQNLYPDLDGLSQLLATLDMYISGDKKINGEVDWYGVLCVQPFADEDTIRKLYRKLALILHPDKNKSNLNLTGIGTNVLNGNSSPSLATTIRNGFHNFSKVHISNTSNQHVASYSKASPPQSARNDTFWTTCSSSKMHFEHHRVHVNLNLTCMNCHSHFLGVEMPSPPINGSTKYTPFSDFRQQQKFHKVHNTEQRSSGLNSSTKICQKGEFPKSGSYTNVAQEASFTAQVASFAAQAAGVNHSTGETLKRGIKKSHTGTMREESLAMKFHPSQKTDSGLGTGYSGSVSSFAGKKSRPKKRCIDETELGKPMSMGNERVSFVAGMMKMAQIKIRKHLSSSNPASVSNASNKQKPFDEGMDKKAEGKGKDAPSMKPGIDKSMEFADIKSSIQAKRSYTVDLDVSATKEPELMAMDVPDPDFHDFDQDRSEKSFGGNQVWAAYDDDGGMPRFYAMIHSVISLKPFKMMMSWLNSKNNSELAPLNWIGSGFYKTSGDFWISKYEVRSLNSFSHRVKWLKGRKGAIQIYPKKKGVAVAPLVKVPGFKTVFQKNYSPSKTWVIPREDLFRLSHEVPSHLLTGQEGENTPKGCLELDPVATPLELLQVLTKAQLEEMEDIKERAREDSSISVYSKRLKVKELLGNDLKLKPNVNAECVGQAIMEQVNKEEKEIGNQGCLFMPDGNEEKWKASATFW